MSRAKNKGQEIAVDKFGVDQEIPIPLDDPKVRYYQWLRSYFGMKPNYNANKCPFYQFMLWGTLIMTCLFPLIITGWIVEKLINGVGIIAPSISIAYHNFKKLNGTIITVILINVGVAALFMIFYAQIFVYVGYGIYFALSFPAYVAYWLYLLAGWTIITAIPFVIASIFNVPWIPVFEYSLYIFGTLLATIIVVYLLYKIFVWFSNTKLFNSLITKSCETRDTLVEKAQDRKQKLQDRIQEREIKDFDDQSILTKLSSFFSGVGKGLYYIFRPLLFVLKSIWWVFVKIGEVFIVIYSILTNTVSNHCPPMVFTVPFDGVGKIKYDFYFCDEYRHGHAIEIENKTIVIPDDFKFPNDFKIKDNMKINIYCVIEKTPSGYKLYKVNLIEEHIEIEDKEPN